MEKTRTRLQITNRSSNNTQWLINSLGHLQMSQWCNSFLFISHQKTSNISPSSVFSNHSPFHWSVTRTSEKLKSSERVKLLSHVWLFATPWTIALQTPLFMEFSKQEYWSGVPFPSTGDIPDPGIEPESPALQVGCYCLRHQGSPGELAMCQSGHWGSLEESDPLLHPPVKVVVTLAAVYMHFPCARDYTHIFSILSGVVSKTILWVRFHCPCFMEGSQRRLNN